MTSISPEVEEKSKPDLWIQEGKDFKKTYVSFFAIGFFVSLVYGLQQFYPNLIGPISNVIPTIFASGAFLASFLCARKYGFKLRERNFDRIWFCFSLGTAFWIFAEFTWAIYYFSGVDVPYPGIPDVFYIAAYFPMSLAILMYFRAFGSGLTANRRIAAIGIISMSVSLVLAIVLPIEFSQTLPSTTVITDLTYPVADLLLLSLAIFGLAIFAGGTMGRWWTVLAGAIILDIVADELFLYQVATGTYYNGNIDDLIYVWAYLLFALSFYLHHEEL
ncbi:MAG: hypothetical protein OK439_03770 [Thaumarchaeota archaeon]|nr:hypothetical protein [Nitrososphaerota archaeon]